MLKTFVMLFQICPYLRWWCQINDVETKIEKIWSIFEFFIIQGRIDWAASLDEDAKSFISGMLRVNPSERQPLECILSHPWILKHYDPKPKITSRRPDSDSKSNAGEKGEQEKTSDSRPPLPSKPPVVQKSTYWIVIPNQDFDTA